jgi:outer membrane murein-binding lipoprotein Lpp
MKKISSCLAGAALLGLVGGCEDTKCKADLQAATAKADQLQKDLDAARSESAALKTKTAKMDQLTAQVAALTAENEKLKAAPPAPAPPAKGGKH